MRGFGAEEAPVYSDSFDVYTGNANPGLARKICRYLGMKLGEAEVFSFANENIFVKILDNVREKDVFLVQPTCRPVNQSIMELLIMIDAFKRASAGRITAVIPFYSYGRSDKKDQPRVPITARLVADMITVAGADRVLSMDLHQGQIQGFFNIPVDELTAVHLLSNYFRQKKIENLVVVTDLGYAKRARTFAELLDAPLAIIEKRRVGNLDRAEVMNVIGEVRNRRAIIVDDEIDTGGTLFEVVRALQGEGVEEIYACATHGVLSDPAIDRIAASGLREVVLTDSIPLPPEKRLPVITTLSVAPLIGEAIRRIHRGESVGALFSSEVTLTQEMILWEDGVEHLIDARTGAHLRRRPRRRRSTPGARAIRQHSPPPPPASHRPASRETDDPPASPARRPGRPRAADRDSEGLARPARIAPLEPAGPEEPGDEPDPDLGRGPLLDRPRGAHVRPPARGVRLRLLEVGVGEPRAGRAGTRSGAGRRRLARRARDPARRPAAAALRRRVGDRRRAPPGPGGSAAARPRPDRGARPPGRGDPESGRRGRLPG